MERLRRGLERFHAQDRRRRRCSSSSRSRSLLSAAGDGGAARTSFLLTTLQVSVRSTEVEVVSSFVSISFVAGSIGIDRRSSIRSELLSKSVHSSPFIELGGKRVGDERVET